MIKKIDDEEERKEVLDYIKNKFSNKKGKHARPGDMSIEDQLADAADTFGRNICMLFIELSLLALVAIGIGYAFGFINFVNDDLV